METKNIYHKLLEAQKEIGAIKKDSDNPFFKSKYFDINAILREVKPILNKHGLVLTQGLNATEASLALHTVIVDADSKEVIESTMHIPVMPDAQKTGSAITYYRRYALQSLLALEAEDDDGNAASQKVTPKSEPKNVEKFMEDLQPTDEEVITWSEKLDSAQNLGELKKMWATFPPMIKAKLEKKKEELKFKLS